MNNKAVTLSLTMAILAIFFVQSYVSSIEEEARKKFGTKLLVLSAKKDIGEMATLDETMLELRVIPKRFLEPAAIHYRTSNKENQKVLQDMKKYAGAVALVPIKKGEQITYNKLTEPSIRVGLAPQVTQGRRAYTIKINSQTAVGKLVKPGDRIDLIATFRGQGQSNVLVKTLLQDVAILAVGMNVTNNVPRIEEIDSRGKSSTRSLARYSRFETVTLELTPQQVQEVALLHDMQNVTLSLSLRQNDDTERLNLQGMIPSDVFGSQNLNRVKRRPARGRSR